VGCFCWQNDHLVLERPTSGRDGLLQQHNQYGVRGRIREVDYLLEAFEQVGPFDKGKGGKYGKPADDLEAWRLRYRT
jgi:hypothetical protein